MHRPFIALALVFTLALAACGSEVVVEQQPEPSAEPSDATTDTTEASGTEPTLTGGPDFDPTATAPPPVVVTRGDARLELDPYVFCWTPPAGDVGICADGMRPAEPPVLSGDGPITVSFPGDFTFSAGGYDAANETRVEGVTIDPVDGVWTIDPGPNDPVVFDLFGVGPEGDVSVTFTID